MDAQKTPRAVPMAASTSAPGSSSAAKGNNARTAAKDLLRDYYGLNKGSQDAKGASKVASSNSDPLNIGE